MMKARLVLWLILLFLQTPLLAQQVSVSGGSTECALWTDSRNTNTSAVLEHFLVGCLNGLSLGTGKEFWQAGGVPISRAAVYAWMDNYCRSNPLNFIAAGSIELFHHRTRVSMSFQ